MRGIMENQHSLFELVKKSRSYRGFDESFRFNREMLERIVDITRFTPSSVNLQPLKYYIAYEQADLDKIQPLTLWAKALPQIELPHPGKCPTAFIVICQDTTISQNLQRFSRDVGIVAQTMLLYAAEQNLGGCMIGSFSPEKLSTALSLPETITPLLVVALGKPDETVVLTDVGEDGSVKYSRDENDVHYVPKRSLSDIIL